MKAQSKLDHEFAEKQKAEIERLKAELGYLWADKEETEVIRMDPITSRDEPISSTSLVPFRGYPYKSGTCQECKLQKLNIRVDIYGAPCNDCYKAHCKARLKGEVDKP